MGSRTPFPSPGQAYYHRKHEATRQLQPQTADSPLLASIRNILDSSKPSPGPHSFAGLTSGTFQREEIVWFERTVVYSEGDVLRRIWNFDHEGQDVHWACWGWFAAASPGNLDLDGMPVNGIPAGAEKEETFGAFASIASQVPPTQRINLGKPHALARGLCVFLRDIGRIFFPSGDEYTFHLPFLVRQAWSLYPHGVLVQREIETSELSQPVEVDLLPTLYSLTHPFGEFHLVPTIPSIIGQLPFGRFIPADDLWRPVFGLPVVPGELKDQQHTDLNPAERVLWLPDRSLSPDPIVVTFDKVSGFVEVYLLLFFPQNAGAPVPPSGPAKEAPKEPTTESSATSSEKPSVPELPAAPKATGGLERRLSKMGLNQTTGGPLGAGDRDRRASVIDKPRLPQAVVDGRNAMRIFSGTKPVDAETVQAAAEATSQPPAAPYDFAQLHKSLEPLLALQKPLVVDEDDIPDKDLLEESMMEPEFVLHHVRTIVPRSGVDPDLIKFYVYDTREVSSMLAMLPPPPANLEIYSILRHAAGITMTKSMEFDVFSVAAVHATRPNVLDLLIVLKDGSFSLILADQHMLYLRLKRAHADTDRVQGSASYQMRLLDEPEQVWLEDDVRLVAVEDAFHSTVTFVLEHGQKVRIDLDMTHYSALAKACLDAICYALPLQESFYILRSFLKAKWNLAPGGNDFDCLANVIIQSLLPGNPPLSIERHQAQMSPWRLLGMSRTHNLLHDDPCLRSLRKPPSPPNYHPVTIRPKPASPYITPVMVALHLVAEDIKTHTSRSEDLCRVVRLVVRLASVVQRDWIQYWLSQCPSAVDPLYLSVEVWRKCTLDKRIDFRPPNLLEYLCCFFTNLPREPYIPLFRVGEFFGLKVSNIMGEVDPCRRTRQLIEIFSVLRHGYNGSLHVSQAINLMSIYGMTPEFLDSVPLGISLPLREAIRKGHHRPPHSAPARLYALMGRKDVALTLFGPEKSLGLSDSYKQRNENDRNEPQQSIARLYADAYANLAGRSREDTGPADQRFRQFTDVRFPDDFRLREVETMLRSSRTCIIRVQERPDASEHDIASEHQMLIMRIAERTLALPVGRAALTFATIPTAQAESYTIPKIEFSVRVLPQGTVLNIDGARLTDEVKAWTDFNNAVAAALRISPTSDGVDGSWIILNKPPELTAHHAGFIFGLGLTGHLRSMLPFQAFGYLAPKHTFTTIAILLGLSASHCGTSNEVVTQMLSVHTPALLPPNSTELNIPVLTQAAGLMGIGLLYLGTRNRRMAQVALHEISRRDLAAPGKTNEHRESYILTAAFAFGMIMIGKGARANNPADMAFVEKLRSLIAGEPPPIEKVGHYNPAFDITLTSPAATVALMLMFLRTNRKDIAALVHPPRTKEELALYPPYLVMLRTIARSIILWDSITLENDWLYDNLPEFLSAALPNGGRTPAVLPLEEEAVALAYMYTIAGHCFGIGLRFAGSANPEAIGRLMGLHDMMNRAMSMPMTGYDHRIKRFAQKECVGAIQLSMAMVAAGTGDLAIFTRLRLAHGQHHNVRFGTHVATHLSLGLLFLGSGRHTLGNSNAAVACLVASLYPRFPGNASDSRAHPQVFRHLWVLAAEPRCLVTRDAETGKIVGLPIRIRKHGWENENQPPMRFMAPTLLPEVEQLAFLDVDSPRYSPLGIDVASNPRHRISLLRHQTMWVKRQAGFLTYEEDIRGMRSLNLHTNTTYSDALALDYPSELPADPEVSEHLMKFVDSNAHAMRTVAFAKYLCQQPGHTPRENALFAFAHGALIECLALDKPDQVIAYLSVFLTRYDDPTESGNAGAAVRNLRWAWNYYDAQYAKFFDTGTSLNRSLGLRPDVIQSALAEAEKRADALIDDIYFARVFHGYIRGHGLLPSGSGETSEVTSRKLAFCLAVYNIPNLNILAIICRNLQQVKQELGSRFESAQFTQWAAFMLEKACTTMGGNRELPNQRITVRGIEEVLKAWA